MGSLIEFYTALYQIWEDQEDAMEELSKDRTYSLTEKIYEDCMIALRENREAQYGLIAHFDIDSAEHAIEHGLPF